MSVRHTLFTNIFLLILTFSHCINYREKINNIAAKAKDLYKKKFHRDKSWHFLGYDRTEYPGTDSKLININQDKWNDYYMCLQKHEENIQSYGYIIPEAILAFEGHLIKLECKICLSPSEVDDMDLVEWYFGKEDSDILLPIDMTEHILISPEDKILHLYNLDMEQTGQYICQLNKQLTAPYFLTVVGNSEPLQEVHNFGVGKRPEPPWILGSSELIMDTLWGPWSPCNRCNMVGKRKKIGYCLITLLENLDLGTNKSEISDKNIETLNYEKRKFENESDMNAAITMNLEYNTDDEDSEIFRVFKYGIPCRSHILPHSLKIAQIRTRQSEILTGFCKVKCPEVQLYVVKDKSGKILETANNSAGIYSMFQGIPNVEPSIERKLQFEETDTRITLICPGNLNTDTPIEWQIGSKKILASVIKKESNGRIYLTIMERIVINHAKVADSGIYSCWQNKELAGSINLVIEKSFKLTFNHHIMLIGIVLIMTTFVYVFVRAFLHRKYAL